MKQPTKIQPIKTCSCGKTFNYIPGHAKKAADAILPGWYWNCDCGSTLVLPLKQLKALVVACAAFMLVACGGSGGGESAAPAAPGVTCSTLAGQYYDQFAPSDTLTISNSCTFTDSVCGYDASYTVPNSNGDTTITVNNTNGTPGCMSNTSHSCTMGFNGVQLAIDCTDSITGNNVSYLFIKQ